MSFLSKWKRIETLGLAYTFLLVAAVGGYCWYTGYLGASACPAINYPLVSEPRDLFFFGVLGSLLFFWRARKRKSE